MQNRRTFLKLAGGSGTALSLFPGLLQKSSETAKASVERRRRRIIWNNDGSDLQLVAKSHIYKNQHWDWPAQYRTVDEFLQNRTV